MKYLNILCILLLSSCTILTDIPIVEIQGLSSDDYRAYPAHVESVYDGDTLTAEFDLGFDLKLTESVRLLGIDAPEVRGESKEFGFISRDYLKDRINGQDVLILVPKKEREKYGRILGIIKYEGVDINSELLELGLAKEYD